MTAVALDEREPDKRRRVAILGGGAGALSTAFALTEQGGYDITVYQMGWRLGGKCASGRRLDDHSGRDQEHGLHILGGFYHNTMGMLREVYADWAKVSKHPLDFDDVFLPQSLVHIIEEQAQKRFPVRFPFPTNDKPLGEQPTELNLFAVAETIIRWIFDFSRSGSPGKKPRGAPYAKNPDFIKYLKKALHDMDSSKLRRAPSGAEVESINDLLAIVQQAPLAPTPPNAQHDPDYGILFEIGLVVAKGFVVDRLARKGFDAANGEEFTAWMTRHGLSDRAKRSSYFRCGYDYAFAYVDGDPLKPEAAAGAALRGFLRMMMTYNGSVFVHMNGGMGEIVFVPLYEVLKRRGVTFKFFHRVDRLELDVSKTGIRRISGIVQNEPIDASYDPLVAYNGRWVWPEKPVEERLKERPEMPARAEFLYESPWAAPQSSKPFALVAGEAFDICVLAIPVGALEPICEELANQFPAWRKMLDTASTTPTLTAQLWQPASTSALGWPNGQTVLTAHRSPLSTWADMSFLLNLETQSPANQLSYFCGPFPRKAYPKPPPADVSKQELARGLAATRSWMGKNLRELMPAATVPGSRVAAAGGEELFVRVNSLPSDSYVLTRPGTVQHRLAPGNSGIANLFLAGDWTKNGFDIGSVETAVVSGLLCAKAIGGTARVPGESDHVV